MLLLLLLFFLSFVEHKYCLLFSLPPLTREGGGVARERFFLLLLLQLASTRDGLPRCGQRPLLLDLRLRGGDDGHGHPVRRARHVVQPRLVEELHGRRLPAVLTADADLEVAPRRTALLHGHLHELTDAALVQHLERVVVVDAQLLVVLQEGTRVVPGEAAAHLRQVVRAEGEELRLARDLVRRHARARHLDHGAHLVRHLHAALLKHPLAHSDAALLHDGELLHLAHERDHDLGDDVHPGAQLHVTRRLEDRLHLHVVDLVVREAEADTAVSQHRVRLRQRADPLRDGVDADAELAREVGLCGVVMRDKLVQGRVQEADGARVPLHRLQDADEVLALVREDLRQGVAAPRLVLREDHLTHGVDAVLLEEHVLRAAQPDALRAEPERRRRVARRVRVRAHAEAADVRRPRQQLAERAAQVRLHQLRLAVEDASGGAVEGQPVALAEHALAEGRPLVLVVDDQLGHAADAALAHAAGDDGRVRRHASARREDALGRVHAA
eukprot:Rhum_TRINITY_DN14960_c6_g1::Rhum_TRINITY_DN14960_c6_g1_i1::g.130403::m.130403